jgi:hypothetical protein
VSRLWRDNRQRPEITEFKKRWLATTNESEKETSRGSVLLLAERVYMPTDHCRTGELGDQYSRDSGGTFCKHKRFRQDLKVVGKSKATLGGGGGG